MMKLVTVIDAAEMLGLQVSTLRWWIHLRRIEVVKLGRLVRISTTEIDRLIAEGRRPARRNRSVAQT